MSKVREETSAKMSKGESPKSAPTKAGRGRFASFLANFARASRYKPTQGKMARLWTAIGLGVVAGTGLLTYHNHFLLERDVVSRVVTATAIGAVAAWIIWRIIEFPPFVDFLIATEAEMVKVSWTTKDDL